MKTPALLLLLGCATVAHAQAPKSYTPSTPPRVGEETILNARVVSVDRATGRLTVRGVDVKADGGNNETFTVVAPALSRLSELKPGMEVLLTLSGTTVRDVKVSVASGGTGGTAIQGSGPSSTTGSAGRARTGATGSGRATTTTGGTAPKPSPTPGMTGVSPGMSGTTSARTNSQGTIVLQGSPSPAATSAGTRNRANASPGTGTSAPLGVVSPQPNAGGPVTGGAPGTVVGGGGVGAAPAPAVATPFPTPRPQPTPIPVGTPPPVGTPAPVLVPADAPSPSPTPGPTPSPASPGPPSPPPSL